MALKRRQPQYNETGEINPDVEDCDTGRNESSEQGGGNTRRSPRNRKRQASSGLQPSGNIKPKKQCARRWSRHPVAIGQRLAVFWHVYDEYFPGVVARVKPNGKAFVQYDDGDKQWVRLQEVDYVLLCDSDSASNQRPDNPPISALTIGTRVIVWWQGDLEFFEGTLFEMDNSRPQDPHRVVYDDGDEEWVNLAFRRFRLLSDRKVKKEE